MSAPKNQEDKKRRAEAGYMRLNDPQQVAAEVGESPETIGRWAALGAWSQKRARVMGDPRGAARCLREVLAQRVQHAVATGLLDPKTTDELAKMGANIARLEGSGYDLRAAAVEVGERLANFAAGWEADEKRRAWLADLLDAFFRRLEEER